MKLEIKEKAEGLICKEGSELYFDAYDGRYFMSNREHIRKCANDLNHKLMDLEDDFITKAIEIFKK